jgi:hypothetical protein
MPPMGMCPPCIAPAVAMVVVIGVNNTTPDNYSLASNYHTFFLANRVTFGNKNGPSTELIDATRFV